MEKHLHNKRFDLKITVLSPLAINSGEELSVFSDYLVHDERVHYIDQEKFIQLLETHSKFAEDYEHQVSNNKEKSVDQFLNKLFKKHSIPIASVVKNDSVEFSGENTLPLRTIIKTDNKPYIPGSAIKGAIRNAILYYYLTVEDTKVFEVFLTNNKKLIVEVIKNKPDVQKYKRHLNNPKRDRSKDQGIRQKLNPLIKKENELNRNIKNLVLSIESKAFGILGKRESLREPMSNVSISDSEPINRSYIAVGNVIRKSLTAKEWTLHTQEYLKEDSVLNTYLQVDSTEIAWRKFRDDSLVARIFKVQNLQFLFKVLRHFSDAVINVQNPFGVDNSTLPQLKHTETLLFLGSGKGIYRNTVMMAIANIYKREKRNFKEGFAPLFYEIKPDYQEFPNTISCIKNDEKDIAMGIVKLEDVKGFDLEVDLKDYDIQELQKGSIIKGVFNTLGNPCYAYVSINGSKGNYPVNGGRNYEKFSQTKLQQGKEYNLEIVAIKDQTIRDLKFVI